MTRRRLIRTLATIILLLVAVPGCAQPKPTPAAPGQTELEGEVVIFHAGSLTVPVDHLTKAFQQLHPHVTFQTEAAGSRTTARKVSELGRPADVVMSADYTVIDNLLLPDFSAWNVRFARNTMVIAYTDTSRFADEINADNWHEVLVRDGVIYGHSEPNADPCGYRTLLVWQLAERHYDEPGLYAKLDEHCPEEHVRPKETDLIALLQSGDMDYAFSYRSIAVQHGLEFVELPEEINLSRVEHADFYSQAAVALSGSEPGEIITMVGKPIVYGVTIPNIGSSPELAVEFVAFLLGEQGQTIMEEQGQPPLVPPVSDQRDVLPAELQALVQP